MYHGAYIMCTPILHGGLRNAVFNPCGCNFRINRITNGPKWSTSKSNGAIGPIPDTIKSTVAARVVKKTLKTTRIPTLETVQWTLMYNWLTIPLNRQHYVFPLTTCATCSELPSNISTMVNTQYCQSLSVSSNIYQISIQIQSLLKLGAWYERLESKLESQLQSTQRVINNSYPVGLSNIVQCKMANLTLIISRGKSNLIVSRGGADLPRRLF